MRVLILALAIALSVGIAMLVTGADADKHSCCSVMGKAAGAPAAPALAQKTCPVTGKPVREDLFVEQEGLKVHFCCPACAPKFKESPMTYLPAVYKQIYPQTVQVKCPVMGGPIDGKTFTEYQGQRVDFCCDDCPDKFKAEPAKYSARLKTVSTDQVRCPVTRKPINPGVRFEYQGKTVYFSSEDALARFKEDMAKYRSALSPDVGVLARGASANDDLILTLTSAGDATTYRGRDLTATSYKGKTYFLKGDDGIREFQADPEKYIKALEAKLKPPAESLLPPMAARGHSGMQHSDTKGGGTKQGGVDHSNMNHGGMDHGGMNHGGGGDHAGHQH